VMNLLHEAEKQAIRLIEEHHHQVVQLVAKLEAEETLDLDAIKSCLVPDSTITPFVKNRKNGTSPSDSKGHK